MKNGAAPTPEDAAAVFAPSARLLGDAILRADERAELDHRDEDVQTPHQADQLVELREERGGEKSRAARSNLV